MGSKSSTDSGQPTPVEIQLDKQFSVFLAERGYDLVTVTLRREHRGWVLRFTVEKKSGGLTVDEGVNVSRELSAAIDADPRLDHLLPEPYNLEVSSPGIFRALTRDRDFERAWEKRVKVSWKKPAEGTVVSSVGQLKGYGEGQLVMIDEKTNEELHIDVQNIKKARLEPELPFGR